MSTCPPFGSPSDRVETASTLPLASYRDPSLFERELEDVFRRGWVSVAHVSELPSSGDYVCCDFFGEPIVVVRGRDGELRALSRVCRHRAFDMLQGRGNAKTFVCPYHRWTYDLDGRLRGAPLMDRAESFAKDDCRLPSLRLEVWEGFVFVNADLDASPLAPELATLSETLAPYDVGAMRVVATLPYDSPWNWKLMIENFMESYHHMGVHRSTLEPTNNARTTFEQHSERAYTLLENPASKPDSHPFWVANVFPSHLFFLSRGEPALGSWYRMEIDAPDHFQLEVKILLHEEAAANPALVEVISKTIDGVHQEDIGACEALQRGIQSRLGAPGRMSHLEGCLHRFHEYLRERVPALESAR